MISIETAISTDLQPVVVLSEESWQATQTPAEIRQYALDLLEAAAAADMDAAVARWVVNMGISIEDVPKFINPIATARAKGFPSCTMNLGSESIRPETARKRGKWLIENACNTEVEAALAKFLLVDMESSPDQVAVMIDDLRAERGIVTDWERSGLNGD